VVAVSFDKLYDYTYANGGPVAAGVSPASSSSAADTAATTGGENT
jgi:hypothetical protein